MMFCSTGLFTVYCVVSLIFTLFLVLFIVFFNLLSSSMVIKSVHK